MIFPALGIRSSVLRADRSFFVSKRAKVRFTRFCSEPRESSVMSWGDGNGLGQFSLHSEDFILKNCSSLTKVFKNPKRFFGPKATLHMIKQHVFLVLLSLLVEQMAFLKSWIAMKKRKKQLSTSSALWSVKQIFNLSFCPLQSTNILFNQAFTISQRRFKISLKL